MIMTLVIFATFLHKKNSGDFLIGINCEHHAFLPQSVHKVSFTAHSGGYTPRLSSPPSFALDPSYYLPPPRAPSSQHHSFQLPHQRLHFLILAIRSLNSDNCSVQSVFFDARRAPLPQPPPLFTHQRAYLRLLDRNRRGRKEVRGVASSM